MAISLFGQMSSTGTTHRQRGVVWIGIILGCAAFWGAGLWLVLSHL